jgi:integrase
METRFFLKNRKNKTTSIIYFSFATLNGDKFRLSSRQTIKTSLWQNGFPKRISQTQEIRKVIEIYKNTVDSFICESVNKQQRQPTKFELAEFVQDLVSGKRIEHDNTIEFFTNEFLNDDSLCLADSTKRVKKIHLDNFVKIIGKKKILVDLNKKIIENYKAKLKRERKRDITTTNNYIKNVIAFLNWLWKKDYISDDLKKYLKKDREIDKDVIALNENELKILETTNFEEIHLQNQIDIFLFGCYTALSIGDIKKVKKEMIDQNNHLIIRRSKNNSNQRIPLIREAIALLEKHSYKLPFISDNKGSENLKSAFRKLNLRRKIRISTQSTEGKVTDQYIELCEIISWHKSRKTAITMLLSKNVHLNLVMAISGHKKTTTMNRYISFAENDLTDAMNKMRS